MGKRDPRVDAYIAKAGDFAKPILNQLRDTVGEWVTEAKSDDTRARRLQTAIGWMAEGKSRNWKYMRMEGDVRRYVVPE